MDLPTPGSPASRITEPGTTPEPSTRSNSPIPVGTATDVVASMSVIRRAGLDGATEAADRDDGAGPLSAIVPQSPHSGHRPTHLAVRNRRRNRHS